MTDMGKVRAAKADSGIGRKTRIAIIEGDKIDAIGDGSSNCALSEFVCALWWGSESDGRGAVLRGPGA